MVRGARGRPLSPREAFEWEGSLRDLYILNTTLADWQALIDFLVQSEYPHSYRVKGEMSPLPPDVARVFEIRDEAHVLFSVNVGGIVLHSHFFCVEQIEFDLDPRAVTGEVDLERLFRFMRRVGQVVGKDVLLTPENAPEIPLYRFSHTRGEVEAVPPPAAAGE